MIEKLVAIKELREKAEQKLLDHKLNFEKYVSENSNKIYNVLSQEAKRLSLTDFRKNGKSYLATLEFPLLCNSYETKFGVTNDYSVSVHYLWSRDFNFINGILRNEMRKYDSNIRIEIGSYESFLFYYYLEELDTTKTIPKLPKRFGWNWIKSLFNKEN